MALETTSELDALLSRLDDIVRTACARVDNIAKEDPISFSRISERAEAISALKVLHLRIASNATALASCGRSAMNAQREEILAAQESLHRAQAAVTIMPPAAAAPVPAKNRIWNGVPPPNGSAKMAAVRVPVSIAGSDLKIEATVIPGSLKATADIFATITPGELYYIASWNHFAVRIGGRVFHANVGKIYRGMAHEAPEYVKECQKSRCRGDKCHYYHNPESSPGSTNVRNYMADSWLYSPTSLALRYGSRHFGSAENLEADLATIEAEDARRYIEQVAHDIICALILWRDVVDSRGRPALNGSAPALASELLQ